MKRDVVLTDEPVPMREMTLEEAEAAERKSGAELRVADGELGAAREELAAARAAFPGAAAQGLEAARGAQRRVNAAEARFRDATELNNALQAAHRPIAEMRVRLWRAKRHGELAAAFAEELRERGRLDSEVVAAVETLGAIVGRRDAATAGASAMLREAEQSGLGRIGGAVDDSYSGAELRAAVEALPPTFRRALYV